MTTPRALTWFSAGVVVASLGVLIQGIAAFGEGRTAIGVAVTACASLGIALGVAALIVGRRGSSVTSAARDAGAALSGPLGDTRLRDSTTAYASSDAADPFAVPPGRGLSDVPSRASEPNAVRRP
jgi:hypothetical protein